MLQPYQAKYIPPLAEQVWRDGGLQSLAPFFSVSCAIGINLPAIHPGTGEMRLLAATDSGPRSPP